MTTFEKCWPLPKANVLLTILRIFAVAPLLSVLTLLTKIANIFAARVPRAVGRQRRRRIAPPRVGVALRARVVPREQAAVRLGALAVLCARLSVESLVRVLAAVTVTTPLRCREWTASDCGTASCL